MLQHVDGEQFVVKGSNWGCHRDPDEEQSKQKTEGVPRRGDFQGAGTKKQPSPQVKQGRENEDQREKHGSGRPQAGMM
jgi:hypothetical protein